MEQEKVSEKITDEIISQNICAISFKKTISTYISQAYAAGYDRGRYQFHKKKRIIQFAMDGTRLGAFNSITQAGKIVGIDKSAISQAARGKLHQAGGFLWMYEDKKYD